MNRPEINIGDVLICAETGERFTAAKDGCSFNYAISSEGEILSDKGVDIREKAALKDRSKPFCCYISTDAKNVTGWKGNMLGQIVSSHRVNLSKRSWIHGSSILSIRVKDIHGGFWYGRGSEGLSVTLRPSKVA